MELIDHRRNGVGLIDVDIGVCVFASNDFYLCLDSLDSTEEESECEPTISKQIVKRLKIYG